MVARKSGDAEPPGTSTHTGDVFCIPTPPHSPTLGTTGWLGALICHTLIGLGLLFQANQDASSAFTELRVILQQTLLVTGSGGGGGTVQADCLMNECKRINNIKE